MSYLERKAAEIVNKGKLIESLLEKRNYFNTAIGVRWREGDGAFRIEIDKKRFTVDELKDLTCALEKTVQDFDVRQIGLIDKRLNQLIEREIKES